MNNYYLLYEVAGEIEFIVEGDSREKVIKELNTDELWGHCNLLDIGAYKVVECDEIGEGEYLVVCKVIGTLEVQAEAKTTKGAIKKIGHEEIAEWGEFVELEKFKFRKCERYGKIKEMEEVLEELLVLAYESGLSLGSIERALNGALKELRGKTDKQ